MLAREYNNKTQSQTDRLIIMKIGFVGLGNVGSKLAGSLLRNGYEVMVRDLNPDFVNDFVSRGASAADSPKQLAQTCDIRVPLTFSEDDCALVAQIVVEEVEALA